MTDQPEESTEVAEPLTEVTEVTEPVEVATMSAEEFLRQAQEPQLAHQIDQLTKEIRTRTGASYREILRGFALVLRTVAFVMPWDEKEGLDARRFHTQAKVSLPSLRECIGVCLGLTFAQSESPDPEASPAPTADEDSDVEPPKD